MRKDKKIKISGWRQKGFVLLEVLIAVIIVLVITLWYINSQIHENDKKIAGRISQQMSQIIDAKTNYFQQEGYQWPPTELLGELKTGHILVDKGYLLNGNLANSFGEPYVFVEPADAQQRDKYIILQTILPAAEGYIAHTAAVPLINAKVEKQSNGEWLLSLSMPQPNVLLDPAAVKYMTAVRSGTHIDADNVTCPNTGNYEKHIFTAVQTCKSETGQPLGGCIAYATGNENNGWNIYMKVLTPSGWQVDPGGNTYVNYIQVSLKCARKP